MGELETLTAMRNERRIAYHSTAAAFATVARQKGDPMAFAAAKRAYADAIRDLRLAFDAVLDAQGRD